jgi:bacteriocin biosynthesis cyclodehydratase domain-containing protein
MRPALRLGLLATWRDRDTVQLGVDERRAVAITGMSEAADVIRLLDGSRDRDQVIAAATTSGVPAAVADRVLTVLAAAGVLIDYPAQLLRSLPVELRRLLLPVLAAASLSGQDSDGGARLLARRSETTVAVTGCGAVAAAVADLLTRSGLAARRENRGAPGQADLSVLVGHQQPEHVAELVRLRRPHLAVLATEAIGVVGPLVRPGSTACLRCLDLARAERDPAWPLVLAQVAGRDADPSGCDPILEAAVAAQAAAVAVAVADRAPLALAAANGTLELVLPAWQWRRRSWSPHPRCSCGSRAA